MVQHSHFTTLMLFLVFLGLSVLANEPRFTYSINGDLPVMTLNADNELEFTYADNRVATISYRENKIKDYEIQLNFKESTCQNNTKPVCTMKVSFFYYELQPVWSSNTKSELVGNTVRPSAEFQENFITNTGLNWEMNFWKNAADKKLLFLENLAALKPTRIVCDDFNWLPSDINLIDEISYEEYQKNLETGRSEKRIITSYRNIKFDRSKKHITFKSIKPYYQSNLSNLVEFYGSVLASKMHLSLSNSRKACQFTIERNTGVNFFLEKLKSDMTPLSSIKFRNLNLAAEKLTLLSHDKLRFIDSSLERYMKDLPQTVQVLYALGLAKIEFSRVETATVLAKITVLEVI